MTDSVSQDVIPYSDEWLRERGARFNPLTGKPVPQMSKVKHESDKGDGPIEGEILPPPPPPPPLVSPDADTKGAATGSTEEPIDTGQRKMPRRWPSRLPLIIGFLLAVVAVLVAEQYLVPMFTHQKKVTNVAPVAPRPASPSSFTPAISPAPKISESQIPSTAKVIPSTSIQRQIPKSIPPVRQVEEPVAPRASVAEPPPAVRQAPTPANVPSASPPAEIGTPSSPSAPPPPQRESKAQFEQQHLRQLLSPLG